jgi:hypothetical protein
MTFAPYRPRRQKRAQEDSNPYHHEPRTPGGRRKISEGDQGPTAAARFCC